MLSLWVGRISPTWNPSTRGLRYVWPRTFWDPDPAPRSPRIQHGSNPEDGDSETAKITAKLSPPSSRYVHHVHARCILHHAGTHSAMRRHLSSESNQRQRAIHAFGDSRTGKVQAKLRPPILWLDEEPTRVQALCWSRPHPGRRQSQYSWAHMDPSAHSLAFRGGAEVPDEEGCYISAACVSRVQGPTTRHSYVGSTAPNSPHTYYGRGAIQEQSYTGGRPCQG